MAKRGRAKSKTGSKSKSLGEAILTAFSHPIRIEIQRIVYARVASPNEIARELREELTTISYHIRVLKECNVIKLVKTEPRRGAVEHFYKTDVPPLYSTEDWEKLPQKTREQISAVTLLGLVGEAIRALDEGTFDSRTNRHLIRMPMNLDEQGWKEFTESQTAHFAEAEEIKANAALRLQESGESGTRYMAGILSFETAPGLGLVSDDD